MLVLIYRARSIPEPIIYDTATGAECSVDKSGDRTFVLTHYIRFPVKPASDFVRTFECQGALIEYLEHAWTALCGFVEKIR
jgi:hypothetical protein